MPPEEKQHVSSEGPEIAEKKLRDSMDTVADAATMKQLMEENAQLRMQLIQCPGEIPATDGKGKSILVVDDEEIVREFLETCLTEAGFNVQTVVDGKAAVELFSSSPDNFDLVILDMIMPGQLSGLDVFKKMKEIRPGQKAILSSGYSLSADIEELLNAGISGILNKPFKIKELFETIQKSLDQS